MQAAFYNTINDSSERKYVVFKRIEGWVKTVNLKLGEFHASRQMSCWQVETYLLTNKQGN
jgi:hypothetical protein